MRRTGGTRVCPCGERNLLLMPIAACGAETVWDVRCAKCGGFAWFDARADAEFRRALAESKASGGGAPEVDRRFQATLPACGCGGAWRVVRDLNAEVCLACGRPLAGLPIVEGTGVDVPPLRPPDGGHASQVPGHTSDV